MKTYDCFTFFNELDLLEIRLNELDSEVDFFVLVEATFTHQGNTKPLFFEINKSRFSCFLPKIIHVIVDDIPENFYTEHIKTWILENHQRNCIARGIESANPEDLILISDVDEIPRASALKKAKKMQTPIAFAQIHHAYYFNTTFIKPKNVNYYKKKILSWVSPKYKFKLIRDSYWLGTILVSKKMINEVQFWRNNRENLSNHIVENAGWHFTYLGGVSKIIEKLDALNEEFDYQPFKNYEILEKALLNKSPILPNHQKFEVCKDENNLPEHVLANKTKFIDYFY